MPRGKPASGISAFAALCQYLFFTATKHWTVFWLRLNRFLVAPGYLQRAATPTAHKVVMVGDGFAEGLGDWVTFCTNAGLARRLANAVKSDSFGVRQIRHRWWYLNRGATSSTSAEWVPGAVGEGGEKPAAPSKSRFDALFGKRSGAADLSVAVVMLGSVDAMRGRLGLPLAALSRAWDGKVPFPQEELADTTRNIVSVCEGFRARGVRVVLCDIAPPAAEPQKNLGEVRRVNRQLADYVAATAAAVEADKKATPAVTLVKLSDHRLQRFDQHIGYDKIHFSAAGYKKLASLMADDLGNVLRACEWEMWKGALSGSGGGTKAKAK